MMADYLSLNYCIIPSRCIQPPHHISVYINCCFRYLAHLLSEIQRCFWFAQLPPSPPSQLSPLSSDPCMLSLFLTGSDLLSNTFLPTTTHWSIPTDLTFLFFLFSHLFLLLLASASVYLGSSCSFICSGLSVALTMWRCFICDSIICLSLFFVWLYAGTLVCFFSFIGMLFFAFVCSDMDNTNWMLRKPGKHIIFNFQM